MSRAFCGSRRTGPLIPLALALVSIYAAAPAFAANHQKQVLAVYSVRRDAEIARIGDRELPRILEENLSESVDYYSEFLDLPRFQDPEYQTAFRDFLLRKYKGQRFDLIIAMSPAVADFFGDHRSELFPDTPIIFFETAPVVTRLPNSTGIIAEPSFSGTVDLARTLQPDLQQVFVVTGSDQEKDSIANESMVRDQLRTLDPQLAVTYLSGLASRDLEARLATLPRHSMVLYVSVNRDATGEFFNPLQYTNRVASVANAPTYSWVDSTMGRGIVGGALKVQQAETAAVAGLALRVLRGEPADSIAPSTVDLNVRQVDWRALQRWGIREGRVPVATLVRFREPTLWDRYRRYILGTVALVVAQSALIALLLVQGARRRQAEAQVRGSQAKLRASYERIRDLGSRLLMAQEAERTRIARELHDDVGQQLALLAIDLELICGVGPDLEAETGALIHETLQRAREIAKSVHDLSHRLHPEKLHLLGLVAALNGIQREFSLHKLATTFAHHDVPDSLPADVTLCLFRVAQEALQNIVKHSEAHAVSIDLCGLDGGLVLTITDDGNGFDGDAAKSSGLGLISMGERLDAIGGSLRIESNPGVGTRLQITVPLERLAATPA